MGRKNRTNQSSKGKGKSSDFNTGRRPQRKKKKDYKSSDDYNDIDFFHIDTIDTFHSPVRIIESAESATRKEFNNININMYNYVVGCSYDADDLEAFRSLMKGSTKYTAPYYEILEYLRMREVYCEQHTTDIVCTFDEYGNNYDDVLPQAAADALFIGMIYGIQHKIYSSEDLPYFMDSSYMRNSALKWILSGIIGIKSYDTNLSNYRDKKAITANINSSFKKITEKETPDYLTDKDKGYKYINALEKLVLILKHIHIDVINELSEEDLQSFLSKIVLVAYIHNQLGEESKSAIGTLDEIWDKRKSK